MYSSLLQLAPGSCDLSHFEKRITVVKAEQIKEITLKNCPGGTKLSIRVKIVVIL